MTTLHVKPLSVNEVWQGKRYKTKKYRDYEKLLLHILPKIALPSSPFKIYLEWGFSSALSDFDNPIKPFVDILQKKYGFNDSKIEVAIIVKKKVDAGNEYIKFSIDSLN